MDCLMLLLVWFCGEGYWLNDFRANARAMDRLYSLFG